MTDIDTIMDILSEAYPERQQNGELTVIMENALILIHLAPTIVKDREHYVYNDFRRLESHLTFTNYPRILSESIVVALRVLNGKNN